MTEGGFGRLPFFTPSAPGGTAGVILYEAGLFEIGTSYRRSVSWIGFNGIQEPPTSRFGPRFHPIQSAICFASLKPRRRPLSKVDGVRLAQKY